MISRPLYELGGDSFTDVATSLVYWALKWSAGISISLALLLGVCVSVARWIQLKTLRQLQHLPGRREVLPFLNDYALFRACSQQESPAAFNTLFFNAISGFHARFQRYGMHRIYTGLSPLIIVYRADYVEEVLKSNTLLKKGAVYDMLHSWLGTGLLTGTGNKWRTRRRLFTPAFHFRILDDFTPTINAQSMILADILGKMSLEHHGVDVVPRVTLCTLDIVCETIMGRVINAQSNQDSEYVKAVNKLGELFLERILTPFARVERIYKMTSNGREYHRCLNTLHSFTRRVISERKEDMKDDFNRGILVNDESEDTGRSTKLKKPFLDLLLIEHFKDNKQITEEDIREEVDTFMFEGHDTTAMGISWALFLIGHSPAEQQKVHDELDSIFGDDTERPVSHEDMKEMRYLECVIKESQRIYPSVPLYTRTVEEPFQLAGTSLPKGTAVQVAAYFLHRDPKVFPKPEEFQPERFLPENAKGRHPFAYVPFSAGPRNCIGQKFAMSEEKIVLANILRKYKLKSLSHRDEVGLVAEIVLRPKNGLRITFTPRATP
ncbi:cytochrome P450 4c3-like [Ixodes scapularis]|uniref:cytochrome P450 4c3-like n=1 Tax=Ixodes scapularis TaxID=6945 RepID=UPI001A9EF5E0|nr:cytochrome P450 4c3-like [Ixodes scapularis]